LTGSRKPRKPTILVDRCLGNSFDKAIRVLGCSAFNLEELFPGRSEDVEDEEWIRLAGSEGWLCLTQNPRIWGVKHEREAILESGARVFSLTHGNYIADAKGVLFGRRWVSIVRRGARPEPCFWTISGEGITKQLS
jgi:hypothetical protein